MRHRPGQRRWQARRVIARALAGKGAGSIARSVGVEAIRVEAIRVGEVVRAATLGSVRREGKGCRRRCVRARRVSRVVAHALVGGGAGSVTRSVGVVGVEAIRAIQVGAIRVGEVARSVADRVGEGAGVVVVVERGTPEYVMMLSKVPLYMRC